MGWWRMNCNGGMSNEGPRCQDGSTPTDNAQPGRDPADDFYMGDKVADILEMARIEIENIYRQTWGRGVSREEMRGALMFVFGEVLKGE